MVTTTPHSLSQASTPSSLSPPPPTIDEDSIDDLLYFSRAAELSDLTETLTTLSKAHNRYPLEIVAAAIDPYTSNTPLHMAAANGHVEIVDYILSLPSPPSPEGVGMGVGEGILDATTSTTSTTAATSGKVASTPAELPSGYMVTLLNMGNNSRNTPLHWACLNGHLEVVKRLVTAGADPGVLNAAGHDCVYEAEVNEKKEVVEWVLAFAEGLEEGVGLVGTGEGGDEEEEEVVEEKTLGDEGARHKERIEKEKKEGKEEVTSGVAVGRLDLGGGEETIR